MDVEAISEWRGQDVLDPDDQKIGRLEEIYYDRHSDAPGFACVATGLFGRRLSFVPLAGASMSRNHVRVAYAASLVKDAPNIDPNGQLTVAEEEALFDHYGLDGALGGDAVSPRLVRYQTQAAAAQVADAREVVADQGPEPVALAAAADNPAHNPAAHPSDHPAEHPADGAAAAGRGGTRGPERRLGRNPVVGRGAAEYHDAVREAAALLGEALADSAFHADATADSARLDALEHRIAAIEAWMAAQRPA